MKYYRVACIFLGWISLASAAELAPSAQQVLQGKLAQLKTFSAAFTQTVTDAKGQMLQQASGRLKLKQPDKLHWQVEEPDENLLIADGRTLWHMDPFVEQVIAMDQQQAVANNPIILLTNPDSQTWQDFDISYAEEGFLVKAKQPESQIASLLLTFKGQTLASLKFNDRQQQLSELLFSEIEQNKAIGDDLFEFSVPAGFELDDQRSQ